MNRAIGVYPAHMTQPLYVSDASKISQSVRKVRSLGRGLDVLRLLNAHNGSTLSQIVQKSGLSRGTAYRLLVTLVNLGFVKRVEPAGHYVLTPRVMALSNGFDAENWPAEVAKPHMIALGEDLSWPVVLATLSGKSMIIRENTDGLTSMVFNVVKPGYRMPVFASASGWIYLAHCNTNERGTLLASIDEERDNPWRELTMGSEKIDSILDRIRGDGYCMLPQSNIRSTVVCVPIFQRKNRFLGALSIRYFSSSMSSSQAKEALVAPMQQCAGRIAADYKKWTRNNGA